jgi:toxin ParE1/3/4
MVNEEAAATVPSPSSFPRSPQYPAMGRVRDEIDSKLRSFSVGKYLIFYVALPDGVEIVRVLHGARDIETIFSDDDE